jgi:zinc finger protein
MANNTQEVPKPDGAAFDQFFDSIGKKAENLTLNEDGKPATNGTDSTSLAVASEEKPEDDEPRVVDEIESLCMNCREHVCILNILQQSKF